LAFGIGHWVVWHSVVYAEFGIPTFGIPSFGIPSFGIPSFGIPSFGIPSFGILTEYLIFEGPNFAKTFFSKRCNALLRRNFFLGSLWLLENLTEASEALP
jgi:hypothetical protein